MRFDTLVVSVWKSDSQVILVSTDVFLSLNKSVCALPQICFTSTDKYTLHGPTNISASYDESTSGQTPKSVCLVQQIFSPNV